MNFTALAKWPNPIGDKLRVGTNCQVQGNTGIADVLD